MAKREEQWVSNRDQTLNGCKVMKGQLIQPSGARNDGAIFADGSRWAYRYRGDVPRRCDTDGCPALFDNDANLSRHRLLVHAPERDARERERLERIRAQREAEEEGATIGGHEIVAEKYGPGGKVPYIAPLG